MSSRTGVGQATVKQTRTGTSKPVSDTKTNDKRQLQHDVAVAFSKVLGREPTKAEAERWLKVATSLRDDGATHAEVRKALEAALRRSDDPGFVPNSADPLRLR